MVAVARRRSADDGAEVEAVEGAGHLLDEVVALEVPAEAAVLAHGVAGDGEHLVEVEGGAEADAGAVALAVEVGGHDERRRASGSSGGTHAADPPRSRNRPGPPRAWPIRSG